MSDRANIPERIYALLLYLLPPRFRRSYGEAMREHFRDRLRDASPTSRNGAALVARTLADVLVTAAAEWPAQLTDRATPSELAEQRRKQHINHTMLRSILDDTRYALRFLAKTPVFTAVAVFVIALGTGAVSTIFSVANGVLIRPLPGISEPRELAYIGRTGASGDGSLSASYVYYEHLAKNSRTMSGISAWSMVELSIRAKHEARNASGNIVSGNYFEVLGARPFLGRFFNAEESSAENTHPVIVVSHAFWRRELNADSNSVGQTVNMNGRPYTVIGVAPPRFTGLYPILRTDVWVPIMMHAHLRGRIGDLRNPNSAWLELIGRVKGESSVAQAKSELSLLTKQYAESEKSLAPEFASINRANVVAWTGLPVGASGAISLFLALLLAVAGFVLLIASINVASMLLARSVSRRREIAVRLALGAGTTRLTRQLLTESLVVFMLGGTAGVAVALLGTRMLTQIELPVDVPLSLDIAPDFRVLAFTLAVAFVTGIVFGLAPALRSTRLDLNSTLRSEGGSAGRARSRLRSSLIICQVALSLVLLAAAGLFTRALDKGKSVEVGFDAQNVATAALNVSVAGYDSTRARLFYEQLATALRERNGVEAVGYARILPLSMSSMGTSITMPGLRPPGASSDADVNIAMNYVGTGYFDAMKLPVVDGRDFTANDVAGAPRVAIVNQNFARTHLGGSSPIGRTFTLDGNTVTIVGVAKDSKYKELSETISPFLYLNSTQMAPSGLTLMVRSTLDQVTVANLIRSEIRALDVNLPTPVLSTLSQATAVTLLPQRAAAGVTAVLGALGLALAAVGLYGALAFSAAQRTREMGVRLALGASPSDLRSMVVGEGMRLVGIGAAIGLVLAVVGSRALVPFLFGLSPLDPYAFVFTTGTLVIAAMLASYLPARRAAAADPVASLRQE